MDIIDNFINFKSKWYQVLINYLVLLIWGCLLVFLGNKFGGYTTSKIGEVPEAIVIIAFSAFLLLLYYFTKTVGIFLFKRVRLGKSYLFRTNDWPNKWIYNGSSALVTGPAGLDIKSTRAGTLLRRYLWSDFEMIFDFEYPPTSSSHTMNYLGIVFRAQDLDNYFMIEVNKKDSDVYVQKLVRFKGGWETSMEDKMGTLRWDRPVKVKLIVNDYLAKLKVGNLFCEWDLPTHVDLNHFESGSQPDRSRQSKYEESKNVQEIPFRRSLGMIGFRAYPGQGAIIRNLAVKGL